MFKLTLAVSALALAVLGAPETQAPMRFKEERMTLEYTVTHGEAVVVIGAETEEGLSQVDIRGPRGDRVFRLRASDIGGSAISGFDVETAEAVSTIILDTYPAGDYEIRGRTRSGRRAIGRATLSHGLLEAPIITSPSQGETGVPADSMLVTWINDPEARGYRVMVEQDENDGLVVELPRNAEHLVVPPGILLPGRESHVEVGAIGPNGNCTLVEVTFTTR